MQVTVVFEDGTIIVNGIAKWGFDLSSRNDNWRVIQWQNDHGWIEVFRGDRVWLNEPSILDEYVNMYNASGS